MPLTYRRAQAQDLTTIESVVVASINDLTKRHGFGSIAAPSPPNFQMFSLNDDPDGLWLAEEQGNIAGFSWSWVCGDFWFLAQLFVDPARQGRGVGNELLKLTLEHARTANVAHRALITFTFNRVSQGLYMRHGLYPKAPIYFFSAPSEQIMPRLPSSLLRSAPIDGTAVQFNELAEIDTLSLGFAREKHHRYLFNDPDTTGLLLHRSGECVGYAYISSTGHVGPLAVTREEVLGDAFTVALRIAAGKASEKVSAFVPGSCESALGITVDCGMRITLPMLLMASSGYDCWTRYLPRNPGFM